VDLVWTTYYQKKVLHASQKIGSFWLKGICSLFFQYRGMSTCKLGDGDTILLWKDIWQGNIPLADEHKILFSFALILISLSRKLWKLMICLLCFGYLSQNRLNKNLFLLSSTFRISWQIIELPWINGFIALIMGNTLLLAIINFYSKVLCQNLYLRKSRRASATQR
jgi:hypothetical protein